MHRLASLGLLVGLIAAPSIARPCGNAVYLETKEAHRLIAKAQKHLDAGRYRRALRTLHDGEIHVDDRNLDRRASLVLAVARMRLGYTTNAAWSLDHLDRAHPNDPEIETRLGEVLARLNKASATAKASKILERLAKDDLMADEFGYLALARLRQASGDLTGAKAAIEACRKRARDPAVCALAAPPKKTKKDDRPPTS